MVNYLIIDDKILKGYAGNRRDHIIPQLHTIANEYEKRLSVW